MNSLHFDNSEQRSGKSPLSEANFEPEAVSKSAQIQGAMVAVDAEDAQLAAELGASDDKLHLTEADIGKTFYKRGAIGGVRLIAIGKTTVDIGTPSVHFYDRAAFESQFQRENPDASAQSQPEIRVGQVWKYRESGRLVRITFFWNNEAIGYTWLDNHRVDRTGSKVWHRLFELAAEPPLATPKLTVNWRPIGEMEDKREQKTWYWVDGQPEVYYCMTRGESKILRITHYAEFELPEGPK